MNPMLRYIFIAAAGALAGLAAMAAMVLHQARGEELVTDLSDHLIAIESTFTGTEILLFGAVEAESPEILAKPRDVVVVVRGPSQQITARRKARVAGIWVNYDAQSFVRVPSYYAVVSTRPLDAIASAEILERHEIGAANLRFAGSEDQEAANDPALNIARAPFRLALIRLKTREGLYRNDPGGILFLGDTLFRANVEIPANTPVGTYTAEVYLFRDGHIVHAQASPLFVTKSGFERFIFNLAHRNPLTYGIIAVIVALLAGWLAAEAFRRR